MEPSQRSWSRGEYLLVAGYSAVLIAFARSYHPTNPPGAQFLWALFGAVLAWCVVRAALGPRPWMESRPVRWVRVLRANGWWGDFWQSRPTVQAAA